MARRLSYSARYAHPVEKLYEAQSSRQYWDDMMAGFQMISPHCEVEDFRSDETGLKVVLKQHIGRDQLPPIAQTVLMKDMVITREESFGPFDPDNTKGNYTASIPAGPGNLQLAGTVPHRDRLHHPQDHRGQGLHPVHQRQTRATHAGQPGGSVPCGGRVLQGLDRQEPLTA